MAAAGRKVSIPCSANMPTDMKKPCSSLTEVRDSIDKIDSVLVPILAERADLVSQAAGFKPTRDAVVDHPRIEQIIAKVREMAEVNSTDPELMEAIYRSMIDAYIAFESRVWDAKDEV
jgi:isochorismate pyruvate lyase